MVANVLEAMYLPPPQPPPPSSVGPMLNYNSEWEKLVEPPAYI